MDDLSFSSISVLLESARHALDSVTIAVDDEAYAPVGIYAGDVAASGTTAELRPNGLFVETDARLPFGTRVDVVLATPGARGHVCVPGVVRWSTARGLGIHYETPRPHDLRAFHRHFGSQRRVH